MTSTQNLDQLRAKALIQLAHEPSISIDLATLDAWLIFVTLQAVVKQSTSIDRGIALVDQFTRRLQATLCTDNPILAALAEEGWSSKDADLAPFDPFTHTPPVPTYVVPFDPDEPNPYRGSATR